jgi:glycine/D-amino acid oxidase-like deaminating enzyme
MSPDKAETYYAASANDPTRYPKLVGPVRADVCVIGGGLSGIATALTLAERGHSVVLLETGRLGNAASGRNGGQMIAGISGEGTVKRQLGAPGARLLDDIRYRGIELIEERVARYAIACDLKHGWVEAAVRPSHMRNLADYYRERRALGDADHLTLFSADESRDITGTSVYCGGIIDQRSGHLHPLNLLLGEARAATTLGARIYENTTAIELTGGARPRVLTAEGSVEADRIVLAGNTDHKFTRGPLHGVQLPIGSYIIATEPLDEALAAEVSPRDYAIADSNIVVDYYRMSADRRMLFGGRSNYSNRDPKDLVATMRPRMAKVYPQLADVRVDFAWGGRLGLTINRAPALGMLEPNIYYVEGFVGQGITTSHVMGEIIADAIDGRTERFDLFARIRHVHLPIGEWAGNQVLALGMLYYRMRDLL